MIGWLIVFILITYKVIKLTVIYHTEWKTGVFCKECHEKITENWDECCTKCGNEINKTYRKTIKWQRTAPWYHFWGRQGYWRVRENSNE